MNLNKDYIITVDVKSATVAAPGKMNFYITDVKTSNIFAQLVFNDSESELIRNYKAVDNAQDFEITLRVIKPNNQFMEIKFALLNQLEAFFMVDLTDEFKDYIGTYKCELFVDSKVNGELERITTASFRYKVLASITNSLDEVIEGDPDYPLVDEILGRLENVDPANFVTVDYVDKAVANKADIEHAHSNYAITANVNMSLATKADKEHTHDDYVTDFKFNTSLATKASKDHTHDDYATNESVDEKIAAIELTPGPQGPAGKDGAQGEQGPAGADGYTPVKGVDYFTDEDIASIKEGLATTTYVDDKIGDIDSALSAILGGEDNE